jgi:molecular chaperone GrpE
MEVPLEQTKTESDQDAEQLAHLKEEHQEKHERYLRTLAEFDNYRRKAQRQHANAAHEEKRQLLGSILDVLDTFDSLFQQTTDLPKALADGIATIRRQFLHILQMEGVRPFESLGQVFDPMLHEPVSMLGTNDASPKRVVAELRCGYLWRGELLRRARVSLSQ